MFAVLPFGNRTVIETLTGAQLTQAFVERLLAVCNPAIADRPLPAGLRACRSTFHCSGTTPVVDGIVEGAGRHRRTADPVGPTDTVRLVTNDFMFTGGDGYTAFTRRPTCCSPATLLLDIAIDYIAANSPVGRSSRAGSPRRREPAHRPRPAGAGCGHCDAQVTSSVMGAMGKYTTNRPAVTHIIGCTAGTCRAPP